MPLDRLKAAVTALKNFHVRARHYQARRWVVYALGSGVFSAVVWTLILHINVPWTVSIVAGLIYGTVNALAQLFWWRPGGRARRNYEAWCDRMNDDFEPIVFPGGSPAPGWYANPERRNRVRFWNGAQWV